MDDALRRLGIVESLVGETRVQSGRHARLGNKCGSSELRSDLNTLDSRIIHWLVATMIVAVQVSLRSQKLATTSAVHAVLRLTARPEDHVTGATDARGSVTRTAVA